RAIGEASPVGEPAPPKLDGTMHVLDDEVGSLLGAYVESARILGQRTAGLHLALAAERDNPDFAPEPFTPHYQRGLYQSMRNLTRQTMLLLKAKLGTLEGEQRDLAAAVIAAEPKI